MRRLTGFNPGATGDPSCPRAGRILDVGCGSGEFLLRMKLQGWETYGVELSARAAEIGKLFANPIAKLPTHWLAKLSDVFSQGDCLEIIARKRRGPDGKALVANQ